MTENPEQSAYMQPSCNPAHFEQSAVSAAAFPKAILLAARQWTDFLTGDIADNGFALRGYLDSLDRKARALSAKPMPSLEPVFGTDMPARHASARLYETCVRLRTLALSYATPGTALYRDNALFHNLRDLLDEIFDRYYTDSDSKTPFYGNWWHWEIGCPQMLLESILLLRCYDGAALSRCLRAVERFTPVCDQPSRYPGSPEMTGANLVDKAVVVALCGILSGDEAKLAHVRQAVATVFTYVTHGDGFYRDGSYVQHQALSYIGGYGMDLFLRLSVLFYALRDTPWSFSGETMVTTQLRRAVEPFFANGRFMDMVSGRSIVRKKMNDKIRGAQMTAAILPLIATMPEGADKDRLLGLARQNIQADAPQTVKKPLKGFRSGCRKPPAGFEIGRVAALPPLRHPKNVVCVHYLAKPNSKPKHPIHLWWPCCTFYPMGKKPRRGTWGNAVSPRDCRLYRQSQRRQGLRSKADAPFYFSQCTAAAPAALGAKLLSRTDLPPYAPENGCFVFRCMDRVVYRAPRYTLGLALCSSRTYGHECLNDEGKQTWNIADGAMTLYLSGTNRYAEGYWASVNPTRLAGITAEQTVHPNGACEREYGAYDRVGAIAFDAAGGDTGNAYGCAWMETRALGTGGIRNGAYARKSWYFLGDAVACLGSGITSNTGNMVETIIDNIRFSGGFTLRVNGEALQLQKGETATFTNPRTVSYQLDSGECLGVWFPPAEKDCVVCLLYETRAGDWNRQGSDSGAVNADFLTIWLSHGQCPANAAYAYLLFPGFTEDECFPQSSMQISANETQHIVKTEAEGIGIRCLWDTGEVMVSAQDAPHTASHVPMTSREHTNPIR